MMIKKTKSIVDAEGNRTTYDVYTNAIIRTVDKHGFIYNAKGERTGHVDGKPYIEGEFYD